MPETRLIDTVTNVTTTNGDIDILTFYFNDQGQDIIFTSITNSVGTQETVPFQENELIIFLREGSFPGDTNVLLSNDGELEIISDNANQYSIDSNGDLIFTFTDNPKAPTNPIASSIEADSFILTVTPPANGLQSGYQWEINSGSGFIIAGTTNSVTPTFTFLGLLESTDYTVRVLATGVENNEYSPVINVTTASAFDPDAQAWFDRMTNPTELEQNSINTFILAEKAAGNFQLYDEFYLFVLGSVNSLVGAKSKTAAPINSPTFDINGVTLNGVDQYINSNWIPSDDSINYSLDNAMFTVFNKEYLGSPSGSNVIFGCRNDISQSVIAFNLSGIQIGINSINGITNIPDYNFDELFSFTRLNPNSIDSYLNGVLQDSVNRVSFDISTFNLFIGSINDSGSADAFYTGTISSFLVGGGTGFNQSAHNTNVTNLLTNLGTLP